MNTGGPERERERDRKKKRQTLTGLRNEAPTLQGSMLNPNLKFRAGINAKQSIQYLAYALLKVYIRSTLPMTSHEPLNRPSFGFASQHLPLSPLDLAMTQRLRDPFGFRV